MIRLGTKLLAYGSITLFPRLFTGQHRPFFVYRLIHRSCSWGQEWAASTPFLFFTDHNAELGRKVTEGRRREFHQFAAFREPAARERIPDPQRIESFLNSKLSWGEKESELHRSALRLYRSCCGSGGKC